MEVFKNIKNEGVLFYAYNFFWKHSVRKIFLEILKNLSEKFCFEIPLDKYVWIPMILQRSIQKPVKIIRPTLNAMLKQGYTVFSVSSTFISNARVKLAKNYQKLSNTQRLKIISHLYPRCHPKMKIKNISKG